MSAGAAVSARLGDELEKIVSRRIAADQLVLPSPPLMAVKCLELLKNPDFSLKDAGALIERDATLTAQLLRTANSAAMATREPAQGVLAAVNRLGAQKLRSFLVEACARKAFESRDTRIAEASRKVWEHSLMVALLARDIAALSSAGNSEMGYLAGLLHDVGKPIVATMLLEAERALSGQKAALTWIDSAAWVGIIQRVHRPVGVALASKWGLPAAVTTAIRDCEEYDSSDRLSVTNAVRFANALAKQEGICVGEVAAEDNDALVVIGRSLLGLDDATVKRALAAAVAALRDSQR